MTNKSMAMIRLLFIFAFCCVQISLLQCKQQTKIVVPFNPSNNVVNKNVIDSIAKINQYSIGYPFNEPLLYTNSYDIRAIANEIVELRENFDINSDELKELAHTVQLQFRNKIKKSVYAIVNYHALKDEIKDPDLDILFSSFWISNQQKYIGDIGVLLEYSKVFIGKSRDAGLEFISNPNQYSSMRSEEETTKHWPAADVILSNPDQSVGLLVEAIQNRKLETHLRLRAVAFLNQLEPELLIDIANEVENEIAQEIICIQKNNISWKYITKSVCKMIERRKLKGKK